MKTSGWPTTSRHERGYGTEWSKLRLVILKRDSGLCQCDQCKGGQIRVRIATEVHHLVSKAKGGTDDPANLQALNKTCHERITAAQEGRRLIERHQVGMDGYPIKQIEP